MLRRSFGTPTSPSTGAFVTSLDSSRLARQRDCRLLWESVDRDGEGPTFNVRQAVKLRGEENKPDVGALKMNASRRTVPLHPLLVTALRHGRDRGFARFVGWYPRKTDYVLPDAEGKAWRPRSADSIKTDLKAAGWAWEMEGQPIDFHATRRSFSTWLEDAGVAG